ncbi:MAG: HAMP domain-containing histidine kinase [Laribacter sp.]|nr:HAMP domain-containing histidine kinase [Laribacter sp.]
MKRWLLHSLLGRFFALLTVSVAAGLASFALLHQLMSPWTGAIQQQIVESGTRWLEQYAALKNEVERLPAGLTPPQARQLAQKITADLAPFESVEVSVYSPDSVCLAGCTPRARPGKSLLLSIQGLANAHWAFRSDFGRGSWVVVDRPNRGASPAIRLLLDRFNLLVALEVLLATAVGLTVLASVMRRSIRRLNRISSALDKLPGTGLDVELPVRGQDELASLETSFNRMAALSRDKAEAEARLARQRSEMVTAVSHDLRSPLTGLLGYLELAEGEDDPERRNRYLAMARQKTDAMRDLATRLQEYASLADPDRVLALRLQPASVSAIVRQRWFETALMLEGQGGMTADSGLETDCMALVDPEYFSRAVGNAIDNAARHLAPGACLQMRLTREAGQIVVAVSNVMTEAAQAGIDAALAAFAAGAPVRRASGGYGFGLAISRQIMRRMGGDYCLQRDGAVLTARLSVPAITTDGCCVPAAGTGDNPAGCP